MANDDTYKVSAASAFVVRKDTNGQLFYRGAPVPADATNLDTLIANGVVEKVAKDDYAGGHPTDVRPDDEQSADVEDDEPKPAARKTAAAKS